jgi:undecaprenyl-diphosphatase
MDILQAVVLGILQGATEFIPVSSSGHLTLAPWLLNWQFDPLLKGAFDVLTHWGTLVAVVGVFWRDLWHLLLGGMRTLGGLSEGGIRGVLGRARADVQGRLAWLIAIGSVPAALLGVLLEDFFEMLFGTPRIVSFLLLVTAGLLTLSEWLGQKGRDLTSLGWLDALVIGLGQALAIAPGISRSGATMASGMLRGVKREDAARFSFLLSTPVIVGAGVWQLKDLFESGAWTAHIAPMAVGFLSSAVVGYGCIRFLLGYLRRGRLYPFAIYCALVGVACLTISIVR